MKAERQSSGPAAYDNQIAMQVVRHIRALIESGQLSRGEKLAPEREFAKQLQVSRASLRAGVGYLAAMGVLKVRHGIGTFVADGPPALGSASFEIMYALHGFTSAQIFEARLVLEGSLAALAAERGESQHFEAMRDEMAEMEATLEHPDAYLIHDVRFHRLIGAASGNPILSALMETISASFYDTRRAGAAHAKHLKETTAMHTQIFEAIRGRHPQMARQLMESHLHRAEELLAAEGGESD